MWQRNYSHSYLTLTLFITLLILIHETVCILSPSEVEVGRSGIDVAMSGEELAQADHAEKLRTSAETGTTRDLLQTLSQSKIAHQQVRPEAGEDEVDEYLIHQPTLSGANVGTISKPVAVRPALRKSIDRTAELYDLSLIPARANAPDTALRLSHSSSQIRSAFRSTSSHQSAASRMSDQSRSRSVHPSPSRDSIRTTEKATSHQTAPVEPLSPRAGGGKRPRLDEEAYREQGTTSFLGQLPGSSNPKNMASATLGDHQFDDISMMSGAGTSSRELRLGDSAPNSSRSLRMIPLFRGSGRESQGSARVRRPSSGQSTENAGWSLEGRGDRERASVESYTSQMARTGPSDRSTDWILEGNRWRDVSRVQPSRLEDGMVTQIRKNAALMDVVPVPREKSTDPETETEGSTAKEGGTNARKRKILYSFAEPNRPEGVSPSQASIGPEREILEASKPVSQSM